MEGEFFLIRQDKKLFWKEVNNVLRIKEQESERVQGTNGEVSEGMAAVKRRLGKYFEGLYNENNESEAVMDCLRKREFKSAMGEVYV